MGFEFIVDHLVDLVLQKGGLLLIKRRIFLEGRPESFLGDLEIIFDDNEGILQYIFEYLHFLVDGEKVFFGLSVGGAGCCDFLLEVGLSETRRTILFLMGS